MKNKKGFTLIELLAVIVILGLLMAIAIPSVTKYITESRRKTLMTTINSYIEAVINQINDGEYNFTNSNSIYAIPIECIALEKGGTTPFGEWMQANDDYWSYVLVQYDDKTSSYTYGFSFKDSAGYGMYPIIQNKIEKSSIKTDLSLTKPKTGSITTLTEFKNWENSYFKVDTNTRLIVLEAKNQQKIDDKKRFCTLMQKGNNYNDVLSDSNYAGEAIDGTGNNIGDKICFEAECFYIVEISDETVTMLAEERINKDLNNPIQNANASDANAVAVFSSKVYWIEGKVETDLKHQYGTSYPAFVYDSNSDLYQYVEAYENYLKNELGIKSVSASLISYDQMVDLGCSCGTVSCNIPQKNKSWISRPYDWWTGSANDSQGNPWVVKKNTLGYNAGGAYFCTSKKSIRPIITVSKSEIKFN